jgi:tRNA-uridine 2-sulfurtransferase
MSTLPSPKTAIALSGGVDSAVAAYLLQQQGHQLTGVFMRFWQDNFVTGANCAHCPENKCCNAESLQLIRRLCVRLDIPLKIYDFRREFKKAIVDRFIDYYQQGLTPNPCVWCNEEIKFRLLWQRAHRELPVDHIATGHYARLVQKSGQIYLRRARDRRKDQSYFLYRLTGPQLAHCLFPVGHLTKSQVKKIAADKLADLNFHQRPESQDLCFVPEKNYQPFIRRHAQQLTKPGAIIDTQGITLGQHQGLLNYTVGQRHGLHLPGGQPIWYVQKIDTKHNQLVVGQRPELLCDTVPLQKLITTPKLAIGKRYTAKLRSSQPPAACAITKLTSRRLELKFFQPQFAPTPGQHCVIYAGDLVVSGGEIKNN